MSFADNSSTNSTALSDQLLIYSGGTFGVIANCLACSSVFLFPFYAYLNIVNRPKDSQRAVFPFLNFFFKIMCFTVIGYTYVTTYCAVVLIREIMNPNYAFLKSPLFRSGGLIILFTVALTVINMPVCQLLTSILAFNRFLLYFLPTIGDFLTPGKKAIQILIGLLYAVVVIGIAILSYINMGSEGSEEVGTFHLYTIGLGLSELLISIPYTFMILSIRKLTHLASKIQSRPEKYIAYQIVIAVVLKFIMFVGSFSYSYFMKRKEDLQNAIHMFVAIDMMTFPLAVQMAYILSNKKNVDTLIAVITGKVMFWKNRARVEVENSTRF